MKCILCRFGWLFALAALASASLQANPAWQDFRVSVLEGNNYRLGNPNRQIYTFEHAARFDWGDSFFFLDHIRSDNGNRDNYAEWAPRWRLSGLSERYGTTLLPRFYLAGTLEMSNQATHRLVGVGSDLSLPGFTFVQVNLYRRFNEQKKDNWQTTISFARPFAVAGQSLLFDGFLDWFSTSPDQRASLNFTSQFKWLLSPLLGVDNKVYLGIEYVWWRNKFGLADQPARPTNESNVNLLVKFHF